MMLKYFGLCLSVVGLTACASNLPNTVQPTMGTTIHAPATTSFDIRHAHTNAPIAFPDFLATLAQADYIILGEYHDSTPQHRLASQLLQDLHQKRPQGSLLLEMLSIDQQPAIDKTAQNPPKFAKLPTALGWQRSWDWNLYGQIVAQPFLLNYPLVATNLTKAEVKTLMQGAEPLKGYLSTSDTIKAVLKARILKAHGFDDTALDKADEKIIDNMVAIQQFRDRRMAEKILSSPKPALLLTGNYHAQKSVGVPMHLADLEYGKTPLTGVVVLMSKTQGEFEPTDADFIWTIAEK